MSSINGKHSPLQSYRATIGKNDGGKASRDLVEQRALAKAMSRGRCHNSSSAMSTRSAATTALAIGAIALLAGAALHGAHAAPTGAVRERRAVVSGSGVVTSPLTQTIGQCIRVYQSSASDGNYRTVVANGAYQSFEGKIKPACIVTKSTVELPEYGALQEFTVKKGLGCNQPIEEIVTTPAPAVTTPAPSGSCDLPNGSLGKAYHDVKVRFAGVDKNTDTEVVLTALRGLKINAAVGKPEDLFAQYMPSLCYAVSKATEQERAEVIAHIEHIKGNLIDNYYPVSQASVYKALEHLMDFVGDMTKAQWGENAFSEEGISGMIYMMSNKLALLFGKSETVEQIKNLLEAQIAFYNKGAQEINSYSATNPHLRNQSFNNVKGAEAYKSAVNQVKTLAKGDPNDVFNLKVDKAQAAAVARELFPAYKQAMIDYNNAVGYTKSAEAIAEIELDD